MVYQDFWGFTWETARGFALGCCLCFVGVYLLTKKGTVADTYHALKEEPPPQRALLAPSASAGYPPSTTAPAATAATAASA